MGSKYIKGEVVVSRLEYGKLGRIIDNIHYDGVIVARGFSSYVVVNLSECSYIRLYYMWPTDFFEQNFVVETISEEDTIILSNKE